LLPNWGEAAAREAAAREEARAYFMVAVLWEVRGWECMCLGGVLLGLMAKTVEMQMQDKKRKPSSRTQGLAGLIYYLLLL
jgi:hypothetical protein